MISRYLVMLLFLFLSNLAYSQSSIYQFEYYFDINKTREHYTAFLVRNEDGTGFIRVKYMDEKTKKSFLADMLMQEHYYGDEDEKDNKKTDSSLLVFEGYDPQMVIGAKGEAYDPDVFWFRKNKKTGYYEPEAVVSIDDNDKEVEGVVTKMKLLNQEDLTKELVSQFFTPKDDFYINLFDVAEVRSLTPQQRSTRLLFLLVANTDDISIGTTCAVDKDATYSTFSQLAEFMGIQFVPKVIYGKDFSKVNVDNAINDIKAGPGDIVVFYYSGHGFSNAKDNHMFPYLDLRDKAYQLYGDPYTLNIEDIYRRIKAKGARLNLVFSDCCNSDPSQSNLISSDGASTRSSSIGWNMENCRSLFMNDKPMSILMTAASKGELSAGNTTGGIFTFNFRESLEKIISPFLNNVSWPALLTTAQKQTINKASHTLCKQGDNSTKVCVQNPVFRME